MIKIEKWLRNHGISYEIIILQDKSTAIMVDNGYEGLYASKEVLNTFCRVKTYIYKNHKDFTVEPRGAYSGILIRKDGDLYV